jgi:FkbM family methyltransferase
LYHKDYEPEVGRVLDASAGHTNLFCDLGANSGLWSVYASTEFGKVIAVEASQATYERLLENTTKVENIVSHRMAIHNNSGETMRFVNVHNSHASAHLDLGGQKGGKDNVESVQTICIDDLVPTGCSALIKLDVEGAEVPAIDGAKRSLMEGSVFIFEDHGSDQSSEVSAHLLRIDGMRLYSIEDGCSPIEDIAQLRVLKSDRFKGYNFLAGREDSVLLSGILDSFTMHSS